MTKARSLLFGFCLAASSCSPPQVTEFEQIGQKQIWSSTNSTIRSFSNGDRIEQVNSKSDWLEACENQQPAWCYYQFNDANKQLGLLYNYYAVVDERELAPTGWKIPNLSDALELLYQSTTADISFIEMCRELLWYQEKGLNFAPLFSRRHDAWGESNWESEANGFNAIGSGGYTPSLNYPDYDWSCKKGVEARFWLREDWETAITLYGQVLDVRKTQMLEDNFKSGRLNEKALVLRIQGTDQSVSFDDEPKYYGYAIRFVRQRMSSE